MTRLPAGIIVLSHFLPLPAALCACIAVVAPLYTGAQVVSSVVSAVMALEAVALALAVVVETLVCRVGAAVQVSMVLAVLFVTLEDPERREKQIVCLFGSDAASWLNSRTCTSPSPPSTVEPTLFPPLGTSAILLMLFDCSGHAKVFFSSTASAFAFFRSTSLSSTGTSISLPVIAPSTAGAGLEVSYVDGTPLPICDG